MKRFYKCSCCTLFKTEKEIDHISYSTDEKGRPFQYIMCKKCEEAGCIGECKILPSLFNGSGKK